MTITITKRGKPVARLVPLASHPRPSSTPCRQRSSVISSARPAKRGTPSADFPRHARCGLVLRRDRAKTTHRRTCRRGCPAKQRFPIGNLRLGNRHARRQREIGSHREPPDRTCGRKAKADRSAVFLHVERGLRDAQRVDELADDLRQVVEGVRELLRRGGVAETEPRIVRRDEPEAVGQLRHQVAEHVRRRRPAMQQQDDGAVRRSGFAVENGGAIDSDGMIGDDGDVAVPSRDGRLRIDL